jgi:hypothetical protein
METLGTSWQAFERPTAYAKNRQYITKKTTKVTKSVAPTRISLFSSSLVKEKFSGQFLLDFDLQSKRPHRGGLSPKSWESRSISNSTEVGFIPRAALRRLVIVEARNLPGCGQDLAKDCFIGVVGGLAK